MTDSGAWTIHCDGSASPNPGRMGLGAVITGPQGQRHTLSLAPPLRGCNNEAELRALMAALHELRAHGAAAVVAYSDNSILVEQLGGGPFKPVARLAALYDEARALLRLFDNARLVWIPGHRNGEADALARAALGMALRPDVPPSKRRR